MGEVSPEIYAQNIGVYLIVTTIIMVFVSEFAHGLMKFCPQDLSPDWGEDVRHKHENIA